MSKNCLLSLALASAWALNLNAASPYAAAVVSYNPGVGYNAGTITSSAVLGEPSRTTDDTYYKGPVDPFNPAYTASQIVSLGSGGSVVVQFDTPITRDAGHLYGMDFIIFGGAGFAWTNAVDEAWNPIGTPRTDGSMFSVNASSTRVSVSQNGTDYYTLDTTKAPVVEGLFPMDGAGNFQKPVNPALTAASFAGASLADVRALYAGSGGGASYSLAWAQDGGGQPVSLSSVSYVRVDVLSGKVELDGFAAVPEPSTWALGLLGAGGMLLWRRKREGV